MGTCVRVHTIEVCRSESQTTSILSKVLLFDLYPLIWIPYRGTPINSLSKPPGLCVGKAALFCSLESGSDALGRY